MWFGKVGLIMWIFSFAILFSTGYLNQIFADPWITNNVTYNSINSTLPSLKFNLDVNSGLIFGDFINTFKFLGNLITGGYFTQVFGNGGLIGQTGFGGIDQWFSLLLALMFDAGTLFFLLYIISNRSI